MLLVLLVACVPYDLQMRAQHDLQSGHKHTWMADHDAIGDRDVYVFCRDKHRGRFDGACIVYTCPPGAAAKACDEAPAL